MDTRIAPRNLSTSRHSDAMRWLNEFILTVKVKQNGEVWDNLPMLDEAYLKQWLQHRSGLLDCEDVNMRGDIVQPHQQGVRIIDNMIAKVGNDEPLSLAEFSLLEDVYRELAECRKWRVYY